jgi:hypothetical protein
MDSCKHFPAATNMHATIEVLLVTVFSIWSVQSGYKEDNWGNPVSQLPCMEAGSNTSTVAPRVVGDEKGT